MKRSILISIFALTFVFGACDVWLEGAPQRIAEGFLWTSIVIVSALVFAWVHLDAAQHSYSKSKWLNVGILGLSIVFVPVYLYRSRPKGAKLKALAGFILGLLGYLIFGYAGTLLAYQIGF